MKNISKGVALLVILIGFWNNAEGQNILDWLRNQFGDYSQNIEQEKCEESLLQIANEYFALSEELDLKEIYIDSLEAAIVGISSQVSGNNRENGLSVIEGIGTELKKKQNEIGQLQNQVTKLRNEVRFLEGIITVKTDSINVLLSEIDFFEEQALQMESKIQNLSSQLEVFEEKLNCVESFLEEVKEAKAVARQEIEIANQNYSFYWDNQSPYSKNYEKGQIALEDAWSTYSKYGALICDSVNCGVAVSGRVLEIKNCENYLDGYASYLVARIAAYSPHIITNDLPDDMNLSDKLNQLNLVLLSSIGQALKKGVYNDKSDAQQLVEELPAILDELPSLIIQERKKSANTDTRYSISQIKEKFNESDYASAISLYSQYQRLFGMEEFQEESYLELIQEARYCAGVILFWNLIEAESTKGLVSENSWLGRKVANQQLSGRVILESLKNELEDLASKDSSDWIQPLLKKTYIALKKEFTISP